MKISTVEKNGVKLEVIETVSRLVAHIPWPARRQAMAEVTTMLLDGKPRIAEDVFGWGRSTVKLGMNELRIGIICKNDLSMRRKPKTEEKYPEMLNDIREIMNSECQADPHLRTTLAYTNMTAAAVRKALLTKGWSEEKLPSVRTMSDILSRQRYRLRSVAKTRVQKKTKWTDPIFKNVHAVNAEADADPKTVRISVDTKAVINVGSYSRGGKSRCLKPVAALDHEMMHKEKLVPGGILEMASGKAFLFFTKSNKTSDFLVDGINFWWSRRKEELVAVNRLVINMDNGPECNGRRSRFLQRMVDFADHSGLEIRLAYYPPYHSKYNGIEHYWGGLERSWNGYLLDSVETVLKRAGNFTWRDERTTVTLVTSEYAKGITLCKKEKLKLEGRLLRLEHLPWWDITIRPLTVN